MELAAGAFRRLARPPLQRERLRAKHSKPLVRCYSPISVSDRFSIDPLFDPGKRIKDLVDQSAPSRTIGKHDDTALR